MAGKFPLMSKWTVLDELPDDGAADAGMGEIWVQGASWNDSWLRRAKASGGGLLVNGVAETETSKTMVSHLPGTPSDAVSWWAEKVEAAKLRGCKALDWFSPSSPGEHAAAAAIFLLAEETPWLYLLPKRRVAIWLSGGGWDGGDGKGLLPGDSWPSKKCPVGASPAERMRGMTRAPCVKCGFAGKCPKAGYQTKGDVCHWRVVMETADGLGKKR